MLSTSSPNSKRSRRGPLGQNARGYKYSLECRHATKRVCRIVASATNLTYCRETGVPTSQRTLEPATDTVLLQRDPGDGDGEKRRGAMTRCARPGHGHARARM